MHFYFLTRGIQQDIEQWKLWMQTRLFPLTFTDTDGTEKTVPLQGALRPVQLWEYVAPETSKDEILNTLNFDNMHGMNAANKVAFATLRKALGAKKHKPYDKSSKFLLPDFPNVHIMPIGIKADKLNWTAPNGRIHEML